MVEIKHGKISRDSDKVGSIRWSENLLVDIFVDPQVRGQGIATEAVSELLSEMRDEGYETARVINVVNPAMKIVLKRNDFTLQKREIPVSDDLKEFVDSDEDLSIDQKLEWRRII